MLMEQKNNKGLVWLIVVLILLVVSMGGFIVYREFFTETGNVNTNESNKNTENKKEFSEDDLFGYLRTVPLLVEPYIENPGNQNPNVYYKKDAYSGGLNTVDMLDREVLFANTFNLIAPVCDGGCDESVLVLEFEENLKKFYNIESNGVDKFYVDGGIVEKKDGYYTPHYGQGSYPLRKAGKTLRYEATNSDLVIYEKAGFYYVDALDVYLLKTTGEKAENYKKLAADDDKSVGEEYITNNIDEFYTFKHTFKLGENNTYYWYSTELTK